MIRHGRALLVVAALAASAWAAAAAEEVKKDPALETYYSANALYNRKLFQLAVEQYKSFLKGFPNHEKAARARLGLALSLYSAGQYAEAEPLLGAAAREAQGDERQELGVLHGQCLLELDRAADAAAVLADAVKRNTGTWKTSALVALTEALYRQQKWPEVVERSEELLKADPKNEHAVRVRFQGAMARYRQGDYKQAGAAFEQLLKPAAGTPVGHQSAFLLAECLRQTGDLEGAAGQYAAAAADKDGAFAAEARFRLGFVRFVQGKYEAAISELKAYADANPKSDMADTARLYLGQCYVQKENYAAAEPVLKALADKPAVAADAVLWLARANARQKKPGEAASVIQAYLPRAANSPQLPGLLYDLGRALMEQSKFGEAAEAFGRVAREFGSWEQAPEALRLQALALHRNREYEKSLAACDALLAKRKEGDAAADVEFMRAENLMLMDKFDDAAKAYGDLLSRDRAGKNADACHFRLGLLEHRGQKWEATLKELRPLTQKKLEGELFSQLGFLVGDACFNLEKWPEAAESLKAFCDSQADAPNRDAALLKLALARARAGDAVGAAQSLQELASKYPKSAHAPMALLELGRLHYDGKRFAEAKQALTQAAAAAGDDAETAAQAAYYLGWIAVDGKDDAEAIKRFGEIAAKYPTASVTADALLQLAAAQLRTGAGAEAEQTASRLLKDFPSYEKADHAVFYLGLSLERRKEWEAALPHFRRVGTFKDSTVRDRALYEGAWCARNLKRADDAAQQYRALLSDFPKSELYQRAAFELAEVDFEGGRFDETVKSLAGLLPGVEDKELREQVLYRLGWGYFSKGDAPAAAGAFESLLADFPATRFLAQASFQAGEARMKGGEQGKALEHFARAAAQTGAADVREMALLRLGETQALTGKWAESEESFAALLKDYPQSQWARRAWIGTGWARENRSKFAEAIEAYERVLAGGETDETAARAQFQIGECLFGMKKYAEAVQALVKVGVSYAYPLWTSRALLETGRALENMNERDRAAEQYKEVAEKYADTDSATVARERLKAMGK